MTTAKSIMNAALAAAAPKTRPGIMVVTLPSKRGVVVQMNAEAGKSLTLDCKQLTQFIHVLQQHLKGMKQ